MRIAQLTAGRYRLAVYRVGYRANDAYTVYLDWGLPNQLTRPQVSELHRASSGEPELTRQVEVGADGVFELLLPLRSNDVYLVTLQPQ